MRSISFVMLLAIDVGSSSVKAALLDGTTILGEVASARFETDHDDGEAQVPASRIDDAIRAALAKIYMRKVEHIGITGMAPAWLAMASDGTALTPIITHQDRRSLEDARQIERSIGRERHLKLAGNRPTPGGISSTVAAWFSRNSDVISTATVLGHLPTYLGLRMTRGLAIDPSNAGFTGLMDVSTSDWSDELCAAAGVTKHQMPPILDAAETIGETLPDNPYGLPAGVPVFGGYVDGSGAMLLTGALPGQLIHSAGTTDVLALCVDKPLPREGLLCRPLGTGGKWIAAATQAAGGAAVTWARNLMFANATDADFKAAMKTALERIPSVQFDPHLAGDRQQVEQPSASLANLTLSTDRIDILAGILHALIADHLERLDRLLALAEEAGTPVLPNVITTGGADGFASACQSRWPGGGWSFTTIDQATLRGLGALK